MYIVSEANEENLRLSACDRYIKKCLKWTGGGGNLFPRGLQNLAFHHEGELLKQERYGVSAFIEITYLSCESTRVNKS